MEKSHCGLDLWQKPNHWDLHNPDFKGLTEVSVFFFYPVGAPSVEVIASHRTVTSTLVKDFWYTLACLSEN